MIMNNGKIGGSVLRYDSVNDHLTRNNLNHMPGWLGVL